ncbi:hypothetical protein KOR42_22710 [Thalassoglobus neptunius]|uniref:Uncharacterized protein n=1 Tax=Thalassoglobus neptunius TaxID=1938619 RepID=A0A5C5X7J6_9PLAN|nr:hypothetical protein [Thalassoglobus neptunius]TWT58884.1 hypothetical protein KOR42_22710 [Thalassoglobus neptunius]
MARQITKELAVKIQKKLGAVILTSKNGKKNKAHDIYVIFHKEKAVARFGIRRGSEKDKGHDHIPGDLSVSPHFAKELGQCTKSKAEWIEEATNKGLIERDEDESSD